MRNLLVPFLAVLVSTLAASAPAPEGPERSVADLERKIAANADAIEALTKKVDDFFFFAGVVAFPDLDKVYLVGPPNPRGEETYGIANERHPFKFWCYVFVPKKIDRSEKHPILVFPHGGVHGDFDTYYTHVVRELMEQGYVVLAPEYRGSTGYGKDYRQAIDYGGLEVDDCVAARDWAVETMPFVDPGRVGILGWSHGGLIALMSIFDHPEKFAAAYAGVPVSDLVARMGYGDEEYRKEFAAPYHIGKTANEAVDEYRRRSPAWNAAKLEKPLLIHTTTNDRDVHVAEVEHLIAQLKAADRKFEYKVYKDFPGGHSMNRTDTALARESRREVWSFLARYLK